MERGNGVEEIPFERNDIIILGFLGLLSVVTGFAAEAVKVKAHQVQHPSPSICVYPQTHASGLGLTSAAPLVLAQIIISSRTGCCFVERGSCQIHRNSICAFVCFFLSWVTFYMAAPFLLAGALRNMQLTMEMFEPGHCTVLKTGMFSGGAVSSLACVVIGIFYYIIVDSEKNKNDPESRPPGGSIAMGRPQFPHPQNDSQDDDPVVYANKNKCFSFFTAPQILS